MDLQRFFTNPYDAVKMLKIARKNFPQNSTVLEPFAGKLILRKVDTNNYFKWTTNDIVPFEGVDHMMDYRDLPEEKYDLIITNPPFYQGAKGVIKMIYETLIKYSDNILIIVPAVVMKIANREILNNNNIKILEDHPSSNRFWDEEMNQERQVRCRILLLKKEISTGSIIKTDPRISFCYYNAPEAQYILIISSVIRFCEKGSFDFENNRRKKLGIRIQNCPHFDLKKFEKVLFTYATEYCSSVLKTLNEIEIKHLFNENF